MINCVTQAVPPVVNTCVQKALIGDHSSILFGRLSSPPFASVADYENFTKWLERADNAIADTDGSKLRLVTSKFKIDFKTKNEGKEVDMHGGGKGGISKSVTEVKILTNDDGLTTLIDMIGEREVTYLKVWFLGDNSAFGGVDGHSVYVELISKTLENGKIMEAELKMTFDGVRWKAGKEPLGYKAWKKANSVSL